MLAGLILLSVMGAFALPVMMNDHDDDGSDDAAGARDGTDDAGRGDLLDEIAPRPPVPCTVETGPDDVAPTDPEGGGAGGTPPDEVALPDDPLIDTPPPGTHVVEGFDPTEQVLTLRLPVDASDFHIDDGDPDAVPPVAPSIGFAYPDGAVTLLFPGLGLAPDDAVMVERIDGTGDPQTVEQMLSDEGVIQPTDPDPNALLLEPEDAGCGRGDTGGDPPGTDLEPDFSLAPAPPDPFARI
ncbi:hypothetical protein E2L08_14335 [Palleronia sediminis]|uniref:Uncharacterized protein n=1 Tax=Palleronia sediminis TaxID=2547833 RepID=A0A4R6A4I0_9RHOB|nr:hypothetical protein [Palleronia sediminis]TDL76006.1 hypothetical protein E2L08_14335 [Palleronia sediminis]